ECAGDSEFFTTDGIDTFAEGKAKVFSRNKAQNAQKRNRIFTADRTDIIADGKRGLRRAAALNHVSSADDGKEGGFYLPLFTASGCGSCGRDNLPSWDH